MDGIVCLTFIPLTLKSDYDLQVSFTHGFFLLLLVWFRKDIPEQETATGFSCHFPAKGKIKAEFQTVAHYRLDIKPVSNDTDTNQPPFSSLNVKKLQTLFRADCVPLVICRETQQGFH